MILRPGDHPSGCGSRGAFCLPRPPDSIHPSAGAKLSGNDAAIVTSLIDGAPGAWEEFVDQYSGLVAAVARRVLKVRGGRPAQADVDDVVENVFVMLLERDGALLKNYDARYRLSAYLAVITRTAVHRFLRRQKAKVNLPDEMWGESLTDPGQAAVSEEQTRGEITGALRDVIAEMSERDQQLLRLFYFEGRDYQAIAEVLRISVNSVGAALSRARNRLAQALTQHRDLTESDWRSI